MARFHGVVGFATSVQTAPGVWEDVVTERTYSGDTVRNARTLRDDEKVNADISANNSISIVADGYANETFYAMRYIRWMGTDWVISNVDVQRPRLVLALGGVYNGPHPAPDSP